MRIRVRAGLLLGSTVLASMAAGNWSHAQIVLPEVKVTAPKEPPKPTPKRAAARKPAPRPATVTRAIAPAPPPSPEQIAEAAAQKVIQESRILDQKRDAIVPPIGATSYEISRDTIETLPGGTNLPLDKVLLQAPGVTQDADVQGGIHVRNEHANIAYRFNGILLPEGVQGFGQVLESSFIGNMALLTGVLPAQYGLRTAGVLDITTRIPDSRGTGSIGVYGGSHQQITPNLDLAASSARPSILRSAATGEPTSASTTRSQIARLSTTTPPRSAALPTCQPCSIRTPGSARSSAPGRASSRYPTRPARLRSSRSLGSVVRSGQQLGDAQREPVREQHRRGHRLAAIDPGLRRAGRILHALQQHQLPPRSVRRHRLQRHRLERVSRRLRQWGAGRFRLQAQLGPHTAHGIHLRSGEITNVNNTSAVLPLDPNTGDIGAIPTTIIDPVSKVGWLAGFYLQDEWKLTNQLTLNAGIRFDQMWQFVNTNQWSPRVNLVYTPWAGTQIHAGYARYFTPPLQALAGPTNTFALHQHDRDSRRYSRTVRYCRSARMSSNVGATQQFGNLLRRRRRLLQDRPGPARRRPVRRRPTC